MNTETIIAKLRLYNRWRRGDEAITAPDPTALGKLLDDAADRIEHLFASGIHTCHADCQRPMCVLRRERDKALADLAALRARVAELDHIRDAAKMVSPAKHPDTELLEWLFCNTIIEGPDGHVIDCRDDADAARKQGGAT